MVRRAPFAAFDFFGILAARERGRGEEREREG
jgi:hypothetical protein